MYSPSRHPFVTIFRVDDTNVPTLWCSPFCPSCMHDGGLPLCFKLTTVMCSSLVNFNIKSFRLLSAKSGILAVGVSIGGGKKRYPLSSSLLLPTVPTQENCSFISSMFIERETYSKCGFHSIYKTVTVNNAHYILSAHSRRFSFTSVFKKMCIKSRDTCDNVCVCVCVKIDDYVLFTHCIYKYWEDDFYIHFLALSFQFSTSFCLLIIPLLKLF